MLLNRFLFRSYRWFYIQEQWRKTRLTRAGTVAAAAIFITGIAGINVFQSAVYQILILCLAYCVMAVISSLYSRVRVRVSRIMPDCAMKGKPCTYILELVNTGVKTEKDLVLFEVPADPRPDLDTLLTRREPFEHRRNAWDRKTLYYRWLWLIRRNEKAAFKPVRLPGLPPGTPVRVRVTLTPHTRGWLNLAGVILARPDPLGLFHHLTRVKLRQKLLVLPNTVDLAIPDPGAGRKYHPGGVRLAASVGNAGEFMSLRDYRPGDSRRHIHWKTYARTGTLVVREFEDEFFVRHALVLDTHPASGDEAVFETAVSVAAGILQGMGQSESLLDLMFVGNRVYSFPFGRGIAHTGKLLEVLACVDPFPDRDISELTAHLSRHLDKLSGSILVFLDWDRPRQDLVKLLRNAGIPVHIILVGRDKDRIPAGSGPVPDDLPPVTFVAAKEEETGAEPL